MNIRIDKKKEAGVVRNSGAIFGDSSDEEAAIIDSSSNIFKQNLKKQSLKIQKASAKVEAELDPSIYDYDASYDIIKKKESKIHPISTEPSGPLYHEQLQRAQQIRENDRLLSQNVKAQKERQLEGDNYKDKEVFVTESYKQKLQDMKQLESQLQQEQQSNAKKNQYVSLKQKYFEEAEARHQALVDMATTNSEVETHEQIEQNTESVPSIPSETSFISTGLITRKKPSSITKPSYRNDATEQFLLQIEESATKRQQEKTTILETLTKRKTDDASILSAKERYLARKRSKQS